MCLKQWYKKREIIKIKWINKNNNLIDIVIKKKSYNVLQHLINVNIINLQIIDWIKQKKMKIKFNEFESIYWKKNNE